MIRLRGTCVIASPLIPTPFKPLPNFCTILPMHINSFLNAFAQSDKVTNEDEELLSAAKILTQRWSGPCPVLFDSIIPMISADRLTKRALLPGAVAHDLFAFRLINRCSAWPLRPPGVPTRRV